MTIGEPGELKENFTAWAKKRALEYVKRGELKQAIDSMVSDLNKDNSRPEEQKQMIAMTGLTLRNEKNLKEEEVLSFIEGFAE